ncbi:hypothetical protein SCA03_29720 [Streptomyces cacaoi]|uniref:Uncharacterized protein n=1 Tax=Streptomyces cacaoi TaxID=1898 RepID=A0A4Y3QYU3_STRCI|nr:hypothetical protein SCA03_29720 [Streptomyces cacaoi]
MGKGSTKGSVQHTKTLPGGEIGCWVYSCEEAATRWIDMERYGNPRFLSTSYCDSHGDWELDDPDNPRRVRKIRK